MPGKSTTRRSAWRSGCTASGATAGATSGPAAAASLRVVWLGNTRTRASGTTQPGQQLADPAPHPTVVANRLALWTMHHCAFDCNMLDVREEIDGPKLRHGSQEMGGQALEMPRSLAAKPFPTGGELLRHHQPLESLDSRLQGVVRASSQPLHDPGSNQRGSGDAVLGG